MIHFQQAFQHWTKLFLPLVIGCLRFSILMSTLGGKHVWLFYNLATYVWGTAVSSLVATANDLGAGSGWDQTDALELSAIAAGLVECDPSTCVVIVY